MIRRIRVKLSARIAVVAVVAVVAAAAALIAVPMLTGGSGSASEKKLASVELAPEPWQGHAKPKYRSEQSLEKAAPWDTPARQTAPAPVDPVNGMPAS